MAGFKRREGDLQHGGAGGQQAGGATYQRIDQMVWSQAQRHPQRWALCTPERSLRYAELAAYMADVRARAQACGWGAGDKVALWLDNRWDALPELLGWLYAGLAVAPLNPRWTAAEQEQVLSALQPAVVTWPSASSVAGRQRADAGQGTCSTGTRLDTGWCWQPYGAGAEHVPEDVFYIGYTSGTTGQPKGIRRTHASWLCSFPAMTKEFALSPGARILVPGPLCYSASLIAALHAFALGGTAEIHARFDAEYVSRRLASGEVDAVFLVPALYRDLVEWQSGAGVCTQPVCMITAGDKMPARLKQQLFAVFPQARLYEYYGTSETGFVTVLPAADQWRKPESVGRVFATAELRVLDGEIQVRSRMGFCGYEGPHARELEARVERGDGWRATGDCGWLDAEGYLYLTGRSEERLVVGGVNVYPRELEQVLERHPAVREVAVIGVPDQRLGEVPVACVVWWNEAAEGELSAYLAATLAPFKRPRVIWSVPALPRNAAGKVVKRALVQAYLAQAAGWSGQIGRKN
ncbi:MAG: acyl--CoA ligase [Alicyclobacillus sp.]|nr:acyl--CoA ligase [Alicyclobacillus sp.]